MHRSVDRMLNQEAAFTASLIRSFFLRPNVMASSSESNRTSSQIYGRSPLLRRAGCRCRRPDRRRRRGRPFSLFRQRLTYLSPAHIAFHLKFSFEMCDICAVCGGSAPLRQNTLDCLPSKYQECDLRTSLYASDNFPVKTKEFTTEAQTGWSFSQHSPGLIVDQKFFHPNCSGLLYQHGKFDL